MEALAFIHAAVDYEGSLPEPVFQLPSQVSSVVTNSAQIGLLGTAVTLATLGPTLGAFAVVKRGDTCPAVRSVQSALVSRGYEPGQVDGVFGSGTEAAIKRFQQDHSLTSDGLVGAKTADALGLGDAENSSSPFVVGCSGSGGGGGGAPTTVQAVQIVTSSGNLRVRSGPGTNYPVVASLANGSIIRTTGKTSNGWTQLVSQAWVATQFTRPTTNGGDSSAGGGGGAPVTKQVQIVTSGGKLRVRSGPGTSFSAISALENGSVIRTTGSVSNGWIQINGGGWVSSQYARYVNQ